MLLIEAKDYNDMSRKAANIIHNSPHPYSQTYT